MSLPDITHLQFLILAILMDGERSGRYIREQLAENGVHKTGPAFYQLMARLEDGNFVRGWYDQKIIDGQIIKERRYQVTGAGVKAWNHVRNFYCEHTARAARPGLANA